MLGAITGDTIGSAYEFCNTKDYDFTLFLGNSAYTDDSIMTVAVAYWLLTDKKHSYQGLEDIMVMFASKCPCPMGGFGEGFYRWLFSPDCLPAYDKSWGKLPYKSRAGRHPYGSWGNGSAMRVSAVGWFFDTLEETERVAAISAAITHNHPEGIKGAQATAAAIYLARKGKTKEEIRSYIEEQYGYDLHKTWEYWHSVYAWESGCQGTVPQAIICFLESDGFEDAIRKAVSLGGDSDTLACITGGIAEAFYREIPEWIVQRVSRPFPGVFTKVLDAMRNETVYGKLCRVADGHAQQLGRFVEAQKIYGYESALEEMRQGRKRGHWIWFIFPQMKGLGHSTNARFYGISSLEEAKAYLEHPVLGPRLREITSAVLSHKGEDIVEMMDSGIDAMKLRSSMTLFDLASPDDIFAELLDAFYEGQRDALTVTLAQQD